jgi:oligo-1,6-glucosidase
MPVPSRGGEINLENDLQSEKSVFRFYQALLKLRKDHGAFRQGRFDVLSRPEDNFFAYKRSLGEEKFTVVCNFESPAEIVCGGMDGTPVLTNCGMKAGERHFPPYGVAVYRN